MITNSPLASHRVKLSDIMDSPARNMKFQQRMDTFLVFSEFLLEGTATIQVWHIGYKDSLRANSHMDSPSFPFANAKFHTFPSQQGYSVIQPRMVPEFCILVKTLLQYQILHPRFKYTLPISTIA